MRATSETRPISQTISQPPPTEAAAAWAQKFLENFSVEMLPRHLPLLQERIAPRLRAGRRVCIALVDPSEILAQVEMATMLRRLGLEPVPHLPARFMGNQPDLELHIKRLTEEAGVVEILALGGGVPTPYGKFHSVMDMLQTGFFQKYGIRRLGFAGHVEGNRDITKGITKENEDAALLQIVRDKAAFAAKVGIDVSVATQFTFDMDAVVRWTEALHAAGIHLPIRVGFAGPAKLKTLLHYSLMCGVGPSIRVLRKQAKAVHRLLKVATPDEIIDSLANRMIQAPPAAGSQGGIVAPHFFPLGGIEATLDWLQTRMPGREDGSAPL